MLGDFPDAVQNAAMESMEAQGGLSRQFFSDPKVQKEMTWLVLRWIRMQGVSP